MSAKGNQPLEGPRFEIGIDDTAYPSALLDADDPPKRIYGIGNPEVLVPGIAVVGARKATPYGLAATRRFASHAALCGVPIVSGGARGCDQAAHKAALDMGTPAVVVFGSGADVVYPRGGRKLFERVVKQGGAVISENSWQTPPLGPYFRRRNRIIAALGMMLIIAEAGVPSGTFSTADAALAAGRVVAAVPGSICSPYSKGTNQLLTQGALPLIDEQHLDQAIDLAFAGRPLSLLEPIAIDDGRLNAEWDKLLDEDEVLRALAAEAYTPSELTAYFGFSAAELARRLSQYELQGLVERGRDGRYQALKPL